MRICGDKKVTANKSARTEEYPLPRIKDLFAALSCGQELTKSDLRTSNCHRNRLPFGVALAHAIFQTTIESLFQGMKHMIAHIDEESDEVL